IYDPSIVRTIAFAGDTDSFTLNVDPGQTNAVVVTPTTATLQPTVTLLDPSSNVVGSATAGAPGQKALIQAVPTATGGHYTNTVGSAGGTAGLYTAQVILNAAQEAEGTLAGAGDDTRDTAQDINGSFLTLQTPQAAAPRGAVLGGNPAVPGPVTTYDFETG